MTNGRSANSLYAARRQRSSNVGHGVYIINILIDDGTPSTRTLIITYKMYIIVKRHRYERLSREYAFIFYTYSTIAFPVIKPYLQRLYAEDIT